MNQEQRRYFRDRIRKIERQGVEIVEKLYTVPEKELTASERFRLVKTGQVRLKKGLKKIDECDDVCDVFDFSKFEWREYVKNEKYVEKRKKSIKRIVSRSEDRLQVCGASEAVTIIKQLEMIIGL